MSQVSYSLHMAAASGVMQEDVRGEVLELRTWNSFTVLAEDVQVLHAKELKVTESATCFDWLGTPGVVCNVIAVASFMWQLLQRSNLGAT